MTLKTQVETKLNELKSYSVAANPATEPFFAPMFAAVDGYFSADSSEMSALMEEISKFMYNDVYRRTTVYENNFDLHCATDFPEGYFDLTDLFYDFAEILETTNAEFYAGWVFDEATLEPTGNSYLSRWEEELTAAPEVEQTKVEALEQWLEVSGGSCDLICLYENRGKIISKKTIPEIAEIIYTERKMKEAIENKELTTYIPTYLRGDEHND